MAERTTPLSPAQAAAGAQAAQRNARDLLRDAAKLQEAGCLARSVVLCILAIEEAAKPTILALIAAADNDGERRRYWKMYTQHTAKNESGAWLYATRQAVKRPDPIPKSVRDLLEFVGDGPLLFERFKQSLLYTDFGPDGSVHEPTQAIGDDVAAPIADAAEAAVGELDHDPLLSERGMSLFVEHMGPAIHSQLGLRAACRRYRQALAKAGLPVPPASECEDLPE